MCISEESKIMFIIYVKSQERSKCFYRELLEIEPSLDVPGMTEFRLSVNTTLGIMPEDGIVRLLEGNIPHPQGANGIPRCEIYLSVDSPDDCYNKLLKAGGSEISEGAIRSWGDYVAYGFDPDGHIIAFSKAVSDDRNQDAGKV